MGLGCCQERAGTGARAKWPHFHQGVRPNKKIHEQEEIIYKKKGESEKKRSLQTDGCVDEPA